MRTINPKTGNSCFGCGADNESGLKITFHGDADSQSVWGEFSPLPFMCGGENMMHGGFVALLLDEVSSKVLSIIGKQGLTRNIDVSFKKPVWLENTIRLEAKLESSSGRKYWIIARILNLDGQVLANSKALFLVLNKR